MNEYVYIGKVIGTHALNGEVKIRSYFTFIDKVMKVGRVLYLGEDYIPHQIKSIRIHKENYLVLFQNLENINLVLNLVGKSVYVKKSELRLEKDEYLYDDLLGFNVVYQNVVLGKVSEIFDSGNNQVMRVKMNLRDLLIPCHKEFICFIDEEKKIVKVNLITGMI